MSWVAYVDESIRVTDGVYILAAVTMEDADCKQIRQKVHALGRRGRRFHWNDQEPPGRLRAVGAVAELQALHVVVIGTPASPRLQERARRHCLESLLFHLEQDGVEHVWFESRNALLDRRDNDVIAGFRAQKIITAKIRVGHARPGDEPLLWAADIVAGAVNAAEGGDPRYRAVLEPVLTEHRVTLR